MANIKEQIIDWFNGPQDYSIGLTLLEQVSRKNKVLGKLIRRGYTRASFEKLVWELNKVAGFKKIPAPVTSKNKASKTDVKKVKSTAIKGQTGPKKSNKEEDGKLKYNLIGTRELDSYPPQVRRLVKEYSSLYMQRGKAHAALKRLGDGNDQQVIDSRKPIIDKIAEMQKRLEELHNAFKNYDEKGITFDPEVLWPEKKEEKADTKAPKTVEELKNLNKNLQSSITKDRNLLLYSSKTKPEDGKENLMPAGPKRTTIEKRVAKKEKEILANKQLIADLS